LRAGQALTTTICAEITMAEQHPSWHSAYYAAVSAADDDLEDALGHVRACQDAGEISVREAADERVKLLENHMQRVQDLRREHLGGN
jgi:hypothetical protein